MTYQLTVPNVQKFSGMTHVADTPAFVSSGGGVGCAPFILDGDAVFIYCAYYDYTTIFAVRVKRDGSYCVYGTNIKYGTNWTNMKAPSFLQYLGGNELLLSAPWHGELSYITIPEYFQNGAWIQIARKSLPLPSCPCGGSGSGQLKAVDFANRVAIAEYIQAFSQANNIWASVFCYSPFGISEIQKGYLGNFPSTTDPIGSPNFPNNTNFGYGNGSVAYSMNGGIIGAGLYGPYFKGPLPNNSPYGYLIKLNQTINYGVLNCAGTGVIPTVDASYAYIIDQSLAIFNGMKLKSNYSSNAAGATDVPADAFKNTYGEINLIANANFYNIPFPSIDYAASAVYLSDGYIIAANQLTNTTKLASIYQFSGGQVPVIAPPPNTSQVAHQLVNLHRPVSVIGAYET